MHFSKKKGNKRAFCEKVVRARNPREFWNTYRPFFHGKTKQANDINVFINDKRETAELFNAHFIQIADSVPLMKDTDYGQRFENMRRTGERVPFWFNFEYISKTQAEWALLVRKYP